MGNALAGAARRRVTAGGTFERYMSSMMTAPIVGSLAGNVLRGFRVELDYPGKRLYLSTP